MTEVLNKVSQGKDSFGTYTILTGHEGSGTCFWCGDAFPDKRRRRFCCEKCQHEYDKHFFWPEAAAWCLKRASFKCRDCGIEHNTRQANGIYISSIRLVSHHIIPLDGEKRVYNKLNRPDNLVALCPSCHGKRHAGMNHKEASKPLKDTIKSIFGNRGLSPLQGWDWLHQHQGDPYPQPSIDLNIDGRMVSLTNCRKGDIKKVMRG